MIAHKKKCRCKGTPFAVGDNQVMILPRREGHFVAPGVLQYLCGDCGRHVVFRRPTGEAICSAPGCHEISTRGTSPGLCQAHQDQQNVADAKRRAWNAEND